MEKFKADPLKYEGEIFQVTGKVGVVVDGKFYFDDKHLIIGSDVEAAKGGVTKLKLLVKDSKLYLLDYHNHDYLNFEIGLSVFALLIALVYFFREWKVTLRGFEYA